MNPNTRSKRLAETALFVVAAAWGAAFVGQRTAMAHLGPLGFNGLRFLLGGILISLVALASGAWKRTDRSDTIHAGMLGLLLFAGASFQQIGMLTSTAGKAAFITGLYIVLIPVLLRIFAKRTTSAAVWTGIFLAVAGLFLLTVQSDFTIVTGDLWVLLCAFGFALHIILTERWVQGREPLPIAATQFLVTAVFSLLVASFTESISFQGSLTVWKEILYTGAVSVGFGYTVQTVAQKHTSSVTAGVILSLESVAAVIFGWLFLEEVLGFRQALGCLLMFFGTLLAQFPSKNEGHRASEGEAFSQSAA